MNNKVIACVVVAILAVSAVGVIVFQNNNSSGYDITMACGSKNCYEPFWIAEDKGLFAEEGVKVKMNYVDGGGNAMTSLLSGTSDLTLVGADPAIRMFESSQGGYVIGTIETAKTGTSTSDFAYIDNIGIDLENASTLLNADGSIKVHCGMDTTTGYYSGYISYLYNQKEIGNITDDQYQKLRTVKTVDSDGGIVHVEFVNQVTALSNGNIQMICGGNTIAIADTLDNVSSGSSSFGSVVGGCVIVASKDAYDNKADILVKVLRALDKACELIENPETVDGVSEYCADYYGSDGWTAKEQKNFFSKYYWDICIMTTMDDYLSLKASLIDPKYEGHDYSSLIKDDLVVLAHKGVSLYGGLYVYDADLGKLIESA